MRNAQAVGHASCAAPHSRLRLELCNLLKREGWIADVQVLEDAKNREIVVTFSPEKPALEVTRVSKPGRRMYSGTKELKRVLRGLGIAILSTSQGLMTDSEARKRKIGGEVLCTIS